MKKQLSIYNFSVKNKTDKTVDIYIDGEIVDASTREILQEYYGDETSVSFKSFREGIYAADADTFNIYVNSPGGHVGDAMAMHDFLKELQNKGKTVNTIGTGIVASAATYILMASKNSRMTSNSMFMIHNVSGYAYGDVNQVEQAARTLRKFNDVIVDFYSSSTNLAKDKISKMMDEETWMSAEDAKANGFIAAIAQEQKFKNKISPEFWNFSNMEVLNSYNNQVAEETPSPTLNSLQTDITDMKKLLETISNAMRGVKPDATATPEQIVNQIADAINPVLESALNATQTEITAQVATAMATAMEPVNTLVADLKAENQLLKDEIANKLGAASNTRDKTDAPKAVGAFAE